MSKILLIGCGYWGKNWYKTINNSPYTLAGVVDPNPSIAIEAPLFCDIEQVDVEYTHAIIAVNARLHVCLSEFLNIPAQNILIEKPCGTSLSDSNSLKETFPGYIFLYSAAYEYIKKNIKDIGTPLYWKSIRASMGPKVRSDVSILEDYMIHDIYLYLDLFGKCKLKNASYSKEFKHPIKNSSLSLELLNKVPGQFYSSWHYPDKERKIVISGTQGSFIWINENLYFDSTHYQDNTVIEGERSEINLPSTSNLDRELNCFIKNQRPKISISEVWELLEKIS